MNQQIALLSQEQLSQQQSIGDIRHALTALLVRVEKMEQELATLRAAHQAAVYETTATPVVIYEGAE